MALRPIKTTVALIIEYQGKIVVVKEYDEEGKLVFGIPAGHVELKESIIKAAIREAKEETGLDVKLLALSGIYDYVKDYETIIRYTFVAKALDDTQQLQAQDPDNEIVQVCLYTPEQIYDQKDLWRTRLIGLCLDDYLKNKRYDLDLIKTLDITNEH